MTTLSNLLHFDFSFWTDGSLLVMGFALDNHPTKHRCLSHDTYILAHPAGLTTTPILAKKQALELLPSFIKKNHELFLLHKRIFVGCDCQSALIALAEGPL